MHGPFHVLLQYVQALYHQPPFVLYNTDQRMQEIMEAPQLAAVEKSKLYSDQLNQFLSFKNFKDFPTHHLTPETVESLVQTTPQVPATPVPAAITHYSACYS